MCQGQQCQGACCCNHFVNDYHYQSHITKSWLYNYCRVCGDVMHAALCQTHKQQEARLACCSSQQCMQPHTQYRNAATRTSSIYLPSPDVCCCMSLSKQSWVQAEFQRVASVTVTVRLQPHGHMYGVLLLLRHMYIDTYHPCCPADHVLGTCRVCLLIPELPLCSSPSLCMQRMSHLQIAFKLSSATLFDRLIVWPCTSSACSLLVPQLSLSLESKMH